MSRRGEETLSSCDKGVPGHVSVVPPQEVDAGGWRILAEDLPLPVAVIRSSALLHNVAWMKAFADRHNVRLAPHGKTTMCPALFDLQLTNGAWGLTLATPHQLQVARKFGYQRILLANQLVGRAATEWVMDELNRDPEFEFYCLLDSAENLEQLALTARRKRLSRPLRALIEIGFHGGRTGCRTVEQAVALAGLIPQYRDVIALHGIEGYEGVIRGATPDDTIAKVDTFLDSIADCARRCAQQNRFAEGEVLLSAGGSAFFDRVAAKLGEVRLNCSTVVLLRGGCYLTHDHGQWSEYFRQLKARSSSSDQNQGELVPALEIWGYVQSLPQPGLAIATLGKRDVSYDDLPVPVKWCRPDCDTATPVPPEGYRVSTLNDQHCYVSVPPDCPWHVGDLVGFGISHPCLTFDKWRVMHLVDDSYRVMRSIRTYF